MPDTSKSRIYRVRRPWKGEQADVERIGTDAHAEFKDIEKSIGALDDGLRAIEGRQIPEIGTTFIAEKLGTDNYSYTSIGTTRATATEIKGTGGAKFRVQVTTPNDIKNNWIELFLRFQLLNISGSSKSFTAEGQYGLGDTPTTWITTNIGIVLNLGNNFTFTMKEDRHFGIGTAIPLTPNNIYTFRLVVWCTSGGGADVEHRDATNPSFRELIAILHPF